MTVGGIVTATYSYDENGNRLTKVDGEGTHSGTYDDQDRLLTYDDAAYTYTANGELLTKTDAGGTTTYAYDELGNLLRVTKPNADVIEYVIDAASRRIGKKVNGTIVKRWVYTGQLGPSAEVDADGNVLARYVYATRINVPDLMIIGDTVYRILTDPLGSPRLVIDTDTGDVVQRVDYDEFGNVLSDTNPGFQPFGFAGGLYDGDAGFVRFGARDYDPRVGRWVAKDGMLFSGRSSNLYSYALTDPINRLDRNGYEVVYITQTTSGQIIGGPALEGGVVVSGKDVGVVSGSGTTYQGSAGASVSVNVGVILGSDSIYAPEGVNYTPGIDISIPIELPTGVSVNVSIDLLSTGEQVVGAQVSVGATCGISSKSPVGVHVGESPQTVVKSLTEFWRRIENEIKRLYGAP